MQTISITNPLLHSQTSSQWLTPVRKAGKATLLLGAGAIVTSSLFVMMAELIKQDQIQVASTPVVTIDPIIYQGEEEKTIVRPKIKPIEKVIKTPPTKVEPLEPNNNSTGNEYTFNTTVPSNELNVEINLNSTQGDMQATPQFRVDPTYPVEASRDGIEGWVKLGFSVTASGSVTDISIIDSKPANVFNRAARRALKKWKYKPQIVDGKPVAQTNMVVVLDFKLEQ